MVPPWQRNPRGGSSIAPPDYLCLFFRAYRFILRPWTPTALLRYGGSMKSSSEAQLEQIVTELWEAFRTVGHGSISRTEEQLGLSQGYFRNWKRKRHDRPASIDLLVLLRALETLGIDAARFFALALRGDLIERLESEAARMEDNDDESVRALRQRWEENSHREG